MSRKHQFGQPKPCTMCIELAISVHVLPKVGGLNFMLKYWVCNGNCTSVRAIANM